MLKLKNDEQCCKKLLYTNNQFKFPTKIILDLAAKFFIFQQNRSFRVIMNMINWQLARVGR